jgi:hypothetical protein
MGRPRKLAHSLGAHVDVTGEIRGRGHRRIGRRIRRAPAAAPRLPRIGVPGGVTAIKGDDCGLSGERRVRDCGP